MKRGDIITLKGSPTEFRVLECGIDTVRGIKFAWGDLTDDIGNEYKLWRPLSEVTVKGEKEW